ncbi:MAG: chromosomal replication initiator protein DnaA [Burkholderiaceae bacterium]
MQQSWQKCLEQLEIELSDKKFTPWIKPLEYIDYDVSKSTLMLGLGNALKLNIVRENFLATIEQVARQHFDPQTSVSLQLKAQQTPEYVPPANSPVATSNGVQRPAGSEPGTRAETSQLINPPEPLRPLEPSASYENAQETAELEKAGREVRRNTLNRELTFENLVHGKSNQMAVAAALQVVEEPGITYNPLFMYGGVGLGKTHLLNAIGNSFRRKVPHARIAYLHAQSYFDEMVLAIQRKTPQEFKRKYQSLDILLIDDIQFLGNRDRTQEEFFYTFESMFAAKKQMIITCDTYPRHLSNFAERLISRFGSGLIVEIEPPELELRVAILLRKAEQLREKEPAYPELPEEVAYFIAQNVRNNVRELEGALLRTLAYARFHKVDLTVAVTEHASRDLLKQNQRMVSIEDIQKTVADFFKIRIGDMFSKRRPANIARARQVAMYLAKELTQKSFPEIGDAFGGRDHTTVMHAAKRITELRQQDPELNRQIHAIEQSLRS